MRYEWIKLRYTFEGVKVEEKWVKMPITGNKNQDEQYEHFLADYLSPKIDCSEVGRSKTPPTAHPVKGVNCDINGKPIPA